jgi:hypothetical protein
MRWRSVAILGALGPVAAGCNIAHNAARNLINEPHVVWTQHEIKHDLRKAARAAWETARGECPEHADSKIFRDGFIDGYVDYLDRGGNGSLPAVPPAMYTRHEKFFTEDGQCRVKEYFLGFKMGQDVAIASGQRQLLTVPVLLPQQPPGPPAFNVLPPGSEAPPMIPPQPPVGIEPAIGLSRTIPGPLPLGPSRALARIGTKTAPPASFDPIAKPSPAPEPVVKGEPPPEYHPIALPGPLPLVSEPLPLPSPEGPNGPQEWGDLPAIPAAPGSPARPASPAITIPALPGTPGDAPRPHVPPPSPTVRPQLPPNHPQPRK